MYWFFHSDETFWCFSTSGISWGYASGVSDFIVTIFILKISLFPGVTTEFLIVIYIYIYIFMGSPVGVYLLMAYQKAPSEFLHGLMVALIGMNFNLGLFLVHLLEFLLA